ncbi:DUF4113 domain-containing protein [Noviherbaspirillum sedimenti]|nr:DUF4113 domain-containing protein [Noviherbaspirillum sedimenti]
MMERTGNELRGISCLALEDAVPPKQQIVTSRSFGQMVLVLDELNEAVATYMTRAAEKLRHQHAVCGAVYVFIHTNQFRPQDRQYGNGVVMPLAEATSDTRWLTAAALAGLKRIYRPGYAYKKAGVMLLELSPAGIRQASLFDPEGKGAVQSAAVMRAVDTLNRAYGRNTVMVGAAGMQRRWSMRSENRSPRFTTRWEEMPVALAR